MKKKVSLILVVILMSILVLPNKIAAANVSKTPVMQENSKFDGSQGENFVDKIKNVFQNKSHNGFKTQAHEWYYMNENQKKGVEEGPPKETSDYVPKYKCYYIGDKSKKVIYLTFDEGYEKGYTPKILDVLKKHKAKAAFFVVKPYITGNPEIIKRMEREGHLVCNHSVHHGSMPSIYDEKKFKSELTGVEEAYTKVTGKKMPQYFRPPMGKYSELSLYHTQKLGYKTIFWSFAYGDWEPNRQPSKYEARNKILSRTHNGTVLLLHAVSKTNADVLDELLTEWEKQGYKIGTLDELTK
ncbi:MULTISPECIES: delta-lactam-biosynthetic de-N-acetylase [Clostridium]|uniref:delta-lactam-biosynthetic de-N-acetylase n=1 Tax=Clostridium TaxID=1485 RepID=UPI000825DAE4|nr:MULTISPECIES: delta-lactam-biosynthetic de-N-acetylase [Clostridium]PJI08998.1 delta-lactam-biosynthetic de-N-acetylase [Clostridium sp. CT7]